MKKSYRNICITEEDGVILIYCEEKKPNYVLLQLFHSSSYNNLESHETGGRCY